MSTVARDEWQEYYQLVSSRAEDSKNSHQVVIDLCEKYKLLSQDERSLVNELLCEWVVSDERVKRFDSIALIAEFNIGEAKPILGALEAKLSESDDPRDIYERKKVLRIINML